MAEESLTAWDLVRTAHVVGQRFAELFTTLGLTPTQFAVLMHLEADEGLSQSELARLVLVRQQSMGPLLVSLLDRELIARDGPGGRGRRAGLSLTEQGRRTLHRAWPAVHAFNAPAALGLTHDQAAGLAEILRLVRTAVSDTGTAG